MSSEYLCYKCKGKMGLIGDWWVCKTLECASTIRIRKDDEIEEKKSIDESEITNDNT